MFKNWQLKAIRAALGWSQGQLAKKAGLSQATISALESGEIESPGTKAVKAITITFEAEGYFFTDHGIERRETNTFMIEGDDCYLQLLKLASDQLTKGDIFLKSGADERRSTPEVIAQLQVMRDLGIQMQSLIRPGDTFFMGEAEEYRWLDEQVHVRGDVKVIFGDCVAYLVTWAEPAKIIIVNDKIIASEARRMFEYLWQRSEGPTTSTAPDSFAGVDHG